MFCVEKSRVESKTRFGVTRGCGSPGGWLGSTRKLWLKGERGHWDRAWLQHLFGQTKTNWTWDKPSLTMMKVLSGGGSLACSWAIGVKCR